MYILYYEWKHKKMQLETSVLLKVFPPFQIIAFLTQMVEYLHGKQKVTGSSPVGGYRNMPCPS